MRNGYLIAVAPNGSTATIAGTSEGIDPVMARFYLEEKKGSIIPKTAPNLIMKIIIGIIIQLII